jgi:nucleotide-binding universal stress UspA family protein
MLCAQPVLDAGDSQDENLGAGGGKGVIGRENANIHGDLRFHLEKSRLKGRDQGDVMYTNILIPTDGSELAGKAVQHGIALAKRIGAKATVLTVLPPFHTFTTDTQMIEDTPVEYKARMQKHAEKTLGAVANAAHAAGVACETIQVEHEHPYQAIIDTADAKGCDLIVMASHGRHGISAIVLGSETVKVLTHCKIPVLVHR